MGGGGGKSRGRRGANASPNPPVLSSREDLDRALRDAAAKASESDKKKGSLVVLEFTAEWCTVCQKIAPFWRGLGSDAKVVSADRLVALYTIDVDASPDLTNSFGASGLPLFVFLVDGKKVDSLVGAQQTALRKMVLKHASSSNK
ncbi:unnamed protein product [Pseudo-nitzschia multistriata]|uniref:Thioredoxin domain-containing protein n=1 Tax=Pseudo-nitzschia multistriata TaxID=183589 RepID=A0A448YY61_9STRA|nr:unnamed protein product [Pseudo-nitzschia multistriata]